MRLLLVVDDPLPTALVPEFVAKPPPPPAAPAKVEEPKAIDEGSSSKKKKKKDKVEDDDVTKIREKHAKEHLSARLVCSSYSPETCLMYL